MRIIDVEVYAEDEVSPKGSAQARYLVHGLDDVYWTDDLEAALKCIEGDLVRLENNPGLING